jgi:hypothetical protein
MKTLIGISGWHGGHAKMEAQRATWVQDVKGADLVFFKGRPNQYIFRGPQPDEVWLACPDTYPERKRKIIAMIEYGLDHGYDYLWNVGDDVYLRPERLLAVLPYDYCGCAVSLPMKQSTTSENGCNEFLSEFSRIIARNPTTATTACIGWIYGLSRRSMLRLLEPENRDYSIHEDIWVGQKLFDSGIKPTHLEGRIKKTHTHGVPNGWQNQMPPRHNNEVIASCEYTPEQMMGIDKEFKNG